MIMNKMIWKCIFFLYKKQICWWVKNGKVTRVEISKQNR